MMYFRLQDLVTALKDRQNQLSILHSEEAMGDYEYMIRSSELTNAISYIELVIEELESANNMINSKAKSE